jgi:plastocyanin
LFVCTTLYTTDHPATAEDGGFDSATMSQGDSFRHRFTEPGRYPYRCDIHPSMTGTVVVTGEGRGDRGY